MPLVSYTDSDEDEDGRAATDVNSRVPAKVEQAKKLPPTLPTNFHSLYASNTRSSTSDDPALHGGRQRQIPHVVGHWPSFIYLEWLPSDTDLISLDAIIRDAASQLQGLSSSTGNTLTSSLRSELGVRLPLHISLSTPLMLTTDSKDKFAQVIASEIKNSGIAAFRVMPAALRWVHNFDRSRYFLIVTLKRPENDELQKLLTICNKTAQAFSLPQLYTEGSPMVVGVSDGTTEDEGEVFPITTKPQDHEKFHISIGWILEQPQVDGLTAGHQPERLDNLPVEFKQVHLKVGNQITTIPLKTSAKKEC